MSLRMHMHLEWEKRGNVGNGVLGKDESWMDLSNNGNAGDARRRNF